jgi:hypothetical protein
MPTHGNPTSPAVAGSQLLLIDQTGYLYRWDGNSATALITPRTLPPEVRLIGPDALQNAAADKTGANVYVMFLSTNIPRNIPTRPSPRAPDCWYVLYQYRFDGSTLSAPHAIAAMQARSEGHLGGGLAVLDDGSVLFAAGDNGDSYEDGGDFSQDPKQHLAKIVRIDPATGSMTVLGLGVRCSQRLATYTIDGEPWLTFVDPGGWIAEELNAVRVTDLLTSQTPLNFGWGRSPVDGKSREGTFSIDRLGNSIAVLAPGDVRFVDPVAEFGREPGAFVAISGPVHSATSLVRITFLFGDLVSGRLFATTGSPAATRQDVFRVAVHDADGRSITLKSLTANARPDPRFFAFPDGGAGVLLEHTGDFYRVSEER